MSDELKPCPFCGGEASSEFFTQQSGWSIFCDGCHASAATLPAKSEAIAAWNTRPPSADYERGLEDVLRELALTRIANSENEAPTAWFHGFDYAVSCIEATRALKGQPND